MAKDHAQIYLLGGISQMDNINHDDVNTVSNRDLVKLAVLLNKTVYDLDFAKQGKFNYYSSKTLKLIDNLERKYPEDYLLLQIKDAVSGVTSDKLPLYIVTRKILSSVNSKVRFKEMTPSNNQNIFANFFGKVAA